MSLKNKSFYWVGEPPTSNFCEGVILVNQIEEVPVGLGGMVCISYQDTQQMNHALKAFLKRKGVGHGRFMSLWKLLILDVLPTVYLKK